MDPLIQIRIRIDTKMSWIRNTAVKSNLDLPNRSQADIRIIISMCYPIFDISPKLKFPIKTDHALSDIAYRKYRSVCPPVPFSISYRALSDLSTLWGIEATAVNQVRFKFSNIGLYSKGTYTRILLKYLQIVILTSVI
jgi:hypothetical protein